MSLSLTLIKLWVLTLSRQWSGPQLTRRRPLILKNFAQVALWYQKAARFPDSPVIWDYHVILILRPRRKALATNAEQSAMHSSWAYDFDTILDLPCPWEGKEIRSDLLCTLFLIIDPEYLSMSFPEGLLPAYQRSAFHDWPKILFTLSNFPTSRFRVTHGELYLQNFASDRSHMVSTQLKNSGVVVIIDPLSGCSSS